VFQRVSAPTQAELVQLIERIVKRLLKLLTRRGYLVEDQRQTYLDGKGEESALSNLQAAATNYRIGLGPRRGKKVFTLRTLEAEEADAIDKILTYLGLSPYPPPKSRSHYDPFSEADIYSTY